MRTEQDLINWAKVDWKQKTTDIAAKFGCGVHFVSRKRREFSPRTLRTHNRVDWDSVDWTKSDAGIAARHKASVSWVHSKRIQLGHLESRNDRYQRRACAFAIMCGLPEAQCSFMYERASLAKLAFQRPISIPYAAVGFAMFSIWKLKHGGK